MRFDLKNGYVTATVRRLNSPVPGHEWGAVWEYGPRKPERIVLGYGRTEAEAVAAAREWCASRTAATLCTMASSTVGVAET